MPEEKWNAANPEQKTELLRQDLMRIRDAQNGLAREFRDLLKRTVELEALVQSLRPTEVAQQSTPPEIRQADSNDDQGGA